MQIFLRSAKEENSVEDRDKNSPRRKRRSLSSTKTFLRSLPRSLASMQRRLSKLCSSIKETLTLPAPQHPKIRLNLSRLRSLRSPEIRSGEEKNMDMDLMAMVPSVVTDLTDTDLMVTNLTDTDLTVTNLTDTDLTVTNLTVTDLTDTDLTDTDLTDTDLMVTDLWVTDITVMVALVLCSSR
jgi:hypothetical protein